MRHAVVLIFAFGVSACGGGGSPTNPTAPTPPSTVSLTGTVTGSGAGRLTGASVLILDGPNANRSATTNTSGEFRIDNLTAANANVSANASGYQEVRTGIFINGTTALTFSLPAAPLPPWTRRGSGNDVFDMPSTVSRVRIIGIYNGSSSNFIIRVAGRTVVNELLGTFWGLTRYDGVHLVTGGGVTEIRNSTGVAWSFEEVR